MQYNVPQFIDMEDHIVGPLTAKQLGWLALGGVFLLVLWGFLDLSAFIIAAILIGGLIGALAFYRPNGQPFVNFVMASINFMLHPKMYVWNKASGKIKIVKKEARPVKKTTPKKALSRKKVAELSETLDKD